MTLKNQHVVVMGGSSGIGLGVAKASLAAGATVTLAGRSVQRLESAARLLEAPDRVRTVTMDVTKEADVQRLFEQAPPTHHVMLTAVHAYYQPIRQFDFAEARRTIDSKLIAALHVAKYARPEAGGSLTFTTGIAATRPGPGGSIVAAVNGALHSLVKVLALELAPLRVNALSPGWIDTPLWDTTAGDAKQKRFEQHANRLPIGRIGTPADVAHAALFLMENGFTTGEVLNVDGGHPLV